MANKRIIDISIKAHIEIGSTIEAQHEALTLVKSAHETGDYTAVLARATIDGVRSEMKTRRFPD